MHRSTLTTKITSRTLTCLLALQLAACAGTQQAKSIHMTTDSYTEAADLEWTPLNPARGAASPQAATLWGDRQQSGPCAFLVRFAKGFSSPPHIHNVSYRAVVIDGLIHNADERAPRLWMRPGSFWTQAAGAAHITAASAERNVALVEIDEGPYLVHGVDKQFDTGERPINIDASNLVWLADAEQPRVQRAYLWGSPATGEPYGLFLRLPAGFAGTVRREGERFHAVVIQNSLRYRVNQGADSAELSQGSYVPAGSSKNYQVSCQQDCTLYIHTNGRLAVAAGSD